MESMKPLIIFEVVVLLIIIYIAFSISGKHRDFIKKASQIRNGMLKNEVLELMEVEPTSKECIYEQTILIWKKEQCLGKYCGGTVRRSVKVVLVKDVVVSVVTKNLDKSTFC